MDDQRDHEEEAANQAAADQEHADELAAEARDQAASDGQLAEQPEDHDIELVTGAPLDEDFSTADEPATGELPTIAEAVANGD